MLTTPLVYPLQSPREPLDEPASMNLDDTIVAIATPAGRGGIGVVRLAGARAVEIAGPMLRLRHELEPGRAVFGELVESCGAGTPARLTTVESITVAGGSQPPSGPDPPQAKRAGVPAPHDSAP